MSIKDDLKTKKTNLERLVNEAKTLHASMEADETKRTAENREKLENIITGGKAKRAEIASLESLAEMEGDFETTDARKSTESAPDEAGKREEKSNGQRFVESAQFKRMSNNSGERTASATMQMKAILSGATSGGATIRADRQQEIIGIARQRPPSILNLVNMSETTLNSVEYVRITGRTNSAAIVAEAGIKPESDLALDVVTAAVKVIAHWVKASKQILDDSPRLRNIIDEELTYMLRVKLEDIIIADMLATAGIQTRAMHATTPAGRGQLTSDTIADTLRRAITDIRLEFYEPNGILLNPADGEKLELTKATDLNYVMIYDAVSQRVWRKPVVETPAIAAGTGVVADFKLGYTVWEREDAQVMTGYINDDFTKNLVTILAEARAAYGAVRPKAIERVTII